MIQIKLNGEKKLISKNCNLLALLKDLKLNPYKIAVAKNLEVIPRSELENTRLGHGDEIEIFHAVGGG